MINPMPVFFGNTPPGVTADMSPLWLSNALSDITISDLPEDRFTIITPTLAGENNVTQEPSVWRHAGKWHMLYAGVSTVWYASADQPQGPWTKFGTPVLGTGGLAENGGAVEHGAIYLEGDYVYYTYRFGSAFKIARALLTTPTAFSVLGTLFSFPSGMTIGGNTWLIKKEAVYHLFFECQWKTGNGSNIPGWQTGIAVSDSLVGPYEITAYPLTSLYTINGTRKAAGGPNIIAENGKFYNFYHSIDESFSLPTDGWRAVSDDLHLWYPDSRPFIGRLKSNEIDQVADVTLCQSETGVWWAFWTAAQNNTLVFNINCAPCKPALKMFDGHSWVDVGKSHVPFGTERPMLYFEAPTTTYSMGYFEDIIAGKGANYTINLPPAAVGARQRITNYGFDGFSVTIVPAGTDVIQPSNIPLTNGQSVELMCHQTGRWIAK